MKRGLQLLSLFFVLTVSGCASTYSCWKPWRSGNGEQDLAIEIAVPTKNGVRGLQLDNTNWTFHVIISNVSTNQIRLWEEWCSWGFYSVSFEIITPDGKKTMIEKGTMAWGGNAPDYYILLPGESFAIAIRFNEMGCVENEKLWVNLPKLKLERGQKIRMRAVYRISPEEDMEETDTEGHVTHEMAPEKKYHIWTGKVVSDWKEYVISPPCYSLE